jgi:hypothetical protein
MSVLKEPVIQSYLPPTIAKLSNSVTTWYFGTGSRSPDVGVIFE